MNADAKPIAIAPVPIRPAAVGASSDDPANPAAIYRQEGEEDLAEVSGIGPASMQDAPRDRALADLAQRYRSVLLAYFRRRVDPPHESEDLTQEVMLRLAGRQSGGEIRDVEPYLFQTATHVLTDHYRRRGARGHHLTDTYHEELHAPCDVSPEDTLLGREALARLHDQIVALPERARQAFLLFRFEGMKQADIAQHMGISISAVEKHIKLGMIRIASALAEVP